MSVDAEQLRKLRWRCRRGVRELDILLTRFLDERFERLDEAGRDSFAALLECQDPDVIDWLMERRSDYPPSCGRAVRLLLDKT